MGVVDQPVNQGRRQTVVAKDRVPLGEFEVGGNNQTLAFIACGVSLWDLSIL